MKNLRLLVTGPLLAAVNGLLLPVLAGAQAQDCAASVSKDPVVGGIVCPDGVAATVVPNDPVLVPAATAQLLEARSAEPSAAPYNDDLTANLEVEPEVGSGATVNVSWTGPGNHRDYLAIASPDSPGNQQIGYAYIEQGSPLQLTAPDAPGVYEIRYVEGRSSTVLTRESITVRPVVASLRHSTAVDSGSTFEVTWSGPANNRDYLAIASPDDPAERQAGYAYVDQGSPLQLTAPDTPGEYEIRYIQSQSRTILARELITILPVSASLRHATAVDSGSTFEVTWSGPGNKRDYIVVAAPGDPVESQHSYAYVEDGSSLQLTAPDAPGDYEIRYIQSQSRSILAQQPITVLAVTATLQAVGAVNSGSTIDVTWSGPGNKRDYIALAAPGDPVERQHSYAYVEDGSPLQLTAPNEPGQYEIRYIQSQSRTVLARRAIEVRD